MEPQQIITTCACCELCIQRVAVPSPQADSSFRVQCACIHMSLGNMQLACDQAQLLHYLDNRSAHPLKCPAYPLQQPVIVVTTRRKALPSSVFVVQVHALIGSELRHEASSRLPAEGLVGPRSS